MVDLRTNTRVLWIARAFILLAFSIFLATAFRTGWTHLSTDFPNYYTAAVSVRHHQPLRNYYDWTWFARQMNYAGIDNQVGAYAAQTPLTMLPMVGFTSLDPLAAKRVWLAINLALLAATVSMLARIAGLRWEYVAMLLMCGFRSLQSNFVDGQYYVLLLFLITLIFLRDGASGFLSGVTFGLKLYTGPLLFYFAAKQRWRSVFGMLVASMGMGALAIAMFGWGDCAYYLTHVLPRSLEGNPVDPYNPESSTFSTFLRRLLVREPGLNPSPLLDAPWLFFFGRTAVQLGLLVFATLGIASAKHSDRLRDVAWFVIALLAISANTASYTFILLLAPIVVLLRNASLLKSAFLAASYIALNIHLQPAWLFPKMWLLLLLFLVIGREYWRCVRLSWAVGAAIAVVLLAAVDARNHMRDYAQEPGRRHPQIAIEAGALFSGYPAITRYGLFYQGMGDYRQGINRYVLRWVHEGRIDALDFDGNALQPFAATADGHIGFELVAHGRSTFMQFDPSTGTAVLATNAAAPSTGVSPDGKWTVFSRQTPTSEQLWLKNLTTGQIEQLAGGNCENSSPVWDLDSSAIIFASDCGRAFGLPALYRAPVPR